MILRRIPFYERTPNEMPNIGHFIDSWEKGNSYKEEVPLHIHSNSCINSTKYDDSSFFGYSKSYKNRDFINSIEKNIRSLVLLAIKHNLITYTSCEGHLINNKLYLAHIGIIIKNKHDLNNFLNVICNYDVGVFKSILYETNSNNTYETIEIYISINDGESNNEYFERVNAISSKIAQQNLRI